MSRNGSGNRFAPLLILLGCMWGVYLAGALLPLSLNQYGILPRRMDGLVGILVAPFLHGNWEHITGNTISLLVFGGIISARSSRDFKRATVAIILISGAGVWLFGRSSVHIGASGLVFGYFGYIVTRGWYDRNFGSILVALLVLVLFGGLLWGVLPTHAGISWEGHLFGLLGGFYVASSYRKRRRGLG